MKVELLNLDQIIPYHRNPRKNAPIDRVAAAIKESLLTNSSKAGDTVLDLFGGSGSTMVACHKMGRSARLSEKDPKYCDVIVARMRKLWPGIEVKRNGEKV